MCVFATGQRRHQPAQSPCAKVRRVRRSSVRGSHRPSSSSSVLSGRGRGVSSSSRFSHGSSVFHEGVSRSGFGNTCVRTIPGPGPRSRFWWCDLAKHSGNSVGFPDSDELCGLVTGDTVQESGHQAIYLSKFVSKREAGSSFRPNTIIGMFWNCGKI